MVRPTVTVTANSNSNSNRERIILSIIIHTFNLLFPVRVKVNDKRLYTTKMISSMAGKDRDMASRDTTMLMALMAISISVSAQGGKSTE